MLIGCTAIGTSRKPSGKAARLLFGLGNGTGEPNALKRGQKSTYVRNRRANSRIPYVLFFFREIWGGLMRSSDRCSLKDERSEGIKRMSDGYITTKSDFRKIKPFGAPDLRLRS
jgi:hypothetical protein